MKNTKPDCWQCTQRGNYSTYPAKSTDKTDTTTNCDNTPDKETPVSLPYTMFYAKIKYPFFYFAKSCDKNVTHNCEHSFYTSC